MRVRRTRDLLAGRLAASDALGDRQVQDGLRLLIGCRASTPRRGAGWL
jgi:hypothetical protein